MTHEPHRPLFVLVVDDGPDLNVDLRIVGPDFLPISRREFLRWAAMYDVVELCTALKPMFLATLLQGFDQVVYLDPDTFMVSPLAELPDLLAEHSILLTPHFLEAIAPGSQLLSEAHSLTVGAYNLGFCAVSRRAKPFLDWWHERLRFECLKYPLLGMFVDQKWMDVGSVLFGAHALRHYGYNVGTWNTHERPIECRDGYVVATAAGDVPLRLFHFSGFDPEDPTELSSRLGFSTSDFRSGEGIDRLCREYSDAVIEGRADVGVAPTYGFARDSRGKRMTTRLRRAYRAALLAGEEPPSAFDLDDREAFRRWRRRARKGVAKQAALDVALAAKYALPDEFEYAKKRFGFSRRLRATLLEGPQIRR